MDISLVMFKADGTHRNFPVVKERFVVDRKNNCELRIPLSSVSRQHCEIRFDSGQIKLRNLGSSNGTYHNSTRVQEAVLSAGDELVIGPVVFTVVVNGKPDDIKPVRTLVGVDSDTGQSPRMAEVMPDDVLSAASGELAQDAEAPSHTSTVDLDDPIRTLERLADAEGTTEDKD